MIRRLTLTVLIPVLALDFPLQRMSRSKPGRLSIEREKLSISDVQITR